MKRLLLLLAALALLLGGVGQAKADYIATVTLDTTALTNNSSQGPFQVDFSLQDNASGTGGLNNNTATITNFNLHGGSLTGTGTLIGSGSGNLNSGDTLILHDNPTGFFVQEFTPGSTTPSSLSFTLDLTTNVDPSEDFKDSFDFILLSGNSHANTSGVTIAITGTSPDVFPFGGALGNGVSVPAPVVTEVASGVPEPATLTLLGIGTVCSLGFGWRRRNLAAA
jgi:hypothetical protein